MLPCPSCQGGQGIQQLVFLALSVRGRLPSLGNIPIDGGDSRVSRQEG